MHMYIYIILSHNRFFFAMGKKKTTDPRERPDFFPIPQRGRAMVTRRDGRDLCIQRRRVETLSGWCFGTFFIFPYIGNNHPN